ncbi:hypothetical protein HY494_01485 [Candidatus Woesearchaeota archaeon]|nr:hypothetical protein [Candidatus Woesearchaeota archaeon]
MNKNTLKVLSNLDLTIDRLIISGDTTADSLFSPLTTVTGIKRIRVFQASWNREGQLYNDHVSALRVRGKLSDGENFQVEITYLDDDLIDLGIYGYGKSNRYNLRMGFYLNRLDDYFRSRPK